MTLPRFVIGSGEPTMTFVHGFTQTHVSWERITVPLSSHHRCVVLDAPCHGQAQDVVVDFSAAAELIADAARDTVLVGYSMGGRLALAATVAEPSRFRALVLISATAGIDDTSARDARRDADDRLAERIESIGTSVFLDEWTTQPMFRHTELSHDDLAARRTNAPGSLARSLRTCGTGVQPSLWNDVTKIDLPTLIVAGESDAKYVEIGRRLHDAIRQSELAIIEGSGHATHLDQPDTFIEVLADFLARRVVG